MTYNLVTTFYHSARFIDLRYYQLDGTSPHTLTYKKSLPGSFKLCDDILQHIHRISSYNLTHDSYRLTLKKVNGICKVELRICRDRLESVRNILTPRSPICPVKSLSYFASAIRNMSTMSSIAQKHRGPFASEQFASIA